MESPREVFDPRISELLAQVQNNANIDLSKVRTDPMEIYVINLICSDPEYSEDEIKTLIESSQYKDKGLSFYKTFIRNIKEDKREGNTGYIQVNMIRDLLKK
ncbi:hypothetical protein DLAC_07478 [Tieghemostelium lacteum]|uniref:Uncharacterized protein n=1 Tax=Tieghemostelium lacteum TaxID=361077 RepID=A0A151ZCL8_TIELA|nr:hypothetical protein DLAC_07478 [Tieghemostelium lacteum]|eukprot:KYQ91697.1 hypothetical protein DLAC_07478 [Tieghemostelium lacteum]